MLCVTRRASAYGDVTTTVDHVVPQLFGGGDDPENLLIAHGVCNSRRGTRDVEDVRLELAGAAAAPVGAGAKTAVSIAGASLIALWAGHAFAKPAETGERPFNGEAALLSGVLGTLLLRSLL
ncbi:HNH endonuclease signature motif containing protein [Sorangium sp. So ce375]|uniref:HNH endonuclease n=1 Tax=Sorangium sp. So ce375 TaxID=3133306 RepID=UPI003F5BB43B